MRVNNGGRVKITRQSKKGSRCNSDLSLTLHDLLQLHLQGLDCTSWVVSCAALYSVDGQAALHHSSHVVILKEDHAVCMLDHSAITTKQMNVDMYRLTFAL